ncbi:single stranded DNA-binding domain-containing protein [Anthocerotibacter panamensis]|uniref:hypothetical protein n=1 Tax=Anthocerotibacter panamensis TaxID=2857077 RepID=UPI001C401459|nr:hypothetical protein [Anthocerotibacter panamensis]
MVLLRRSIFQQEIPALLKVVLLILGLTLAPIHAFAALAASVGIDIATARTFPLGSIVTIEGSVTAPSGIFQSSLFDEGFALQDRTGGIYVRTFANLGLPVGQRVRVTGQLFDNFGLLSLILNFSNDVEIGGRGPRVQPERVGTGAVGEATEGLLIRVDGIITQPIMDELPFGHRFFINNGSGEVQVFINTTTGIDVSTLQPGQRVRVTGFSGQAADQYEILPRFTSDIVSF